MRPETSDTSDLYRHAIDAVGAKRVAHALGLSLSHTYRLQRPTMDVDADGTGARSDLDRLETLVDLLAARPAGRPVLIELRGWMARLFDRALGAWAEADLSEDAFTAQVGRAVQEFGEALTCCRAEVLHQSERRRALRKELREAIAALEGLDRSLEEPAAGDALRRVG